jgi:hypothetical protein
MPYRFDDQHDPLISMHIHGWLTDAELSRLFEDLDRLVSRGQAFAAVLDCTGLRVPEVSHVRRLASWFNQQFDEAGQCHRGLACVINTPMIRGTLGALLQLQTMPMPVTVVEELDDGIAWARERLAESKRMAASDGARD